MKYILLLVCFLFFVSGCRHKNHAVTADDVYYTCSMHPQVVSATPGKCPICHMDLVPASKSKSTTTDEIVLSDQQIQLGNIKTDSLKTHIIRDRTVLTATLNVDQQNTNAISARIMGRIDRLYHRNAGDYIKKGEPLYELYSEELNNAKQEYLLTLEKRKTLGNSIIDFQKLVQAARNKLLLWGLTSDQIRQIEQDGQLSTHTTFFSPYSGYITSIDALEGQYVMEGGTILRMAVLTTLWAEAQVYTAQFSQVDLNADAEVQVPGLPRFESRGKIGFLNPEANPTSRITLLRVIVPNKDGELKPGMAANVIIKGKEKHAIVLPIDAVIRDGSGVSVWIQTRKNTFKNKMVSTGVENNGMVEILSGLDTNEVVVTSGAYLLNCEYIIKKGSNPMEGMKM